MKNAVITGAASGIGAAVTKNLADDGLQCIRIDIKDADIVADLSTAEGRQHACREALRHANGKIDRLVLAAGLGGHVDDGQAVVRVNYFGAVELLDGFKDALAAASGRCVVVSSNSAQMRIDPNNELIKRLLDGNEAGAMSEIGDNHGAMVYGASKHALARAVRRRSAEWGEAGITLNAIAPGQTETPLYRGAADHPVIGKSVEAIPIPKKRVATAEEIANMISFMLSDAAEYMQGSIIYVDGGTDAQLRPDQF